MKYIRKAVIPAAGLGTRFLPATISVPKEMLPVSGKPVIQHVVEHAVEAGVEEILIVTRSGKETIRQHFSPSQDLIDVLTRKHEIPELKLLDKVSRLAKIVYVNQAEQKGMANAVYLAKDFVGDDAFAVLSGDTIVDSNSDHSCLSKMIDIYAETGFPVVGTQWLKNKRDVENFGIVEFDDKEPRKTREDTTYYMVRGLVEKPKENRAPSRHGIVPMYVFSPDIFYCIERIRAGTGGELQITDAMRYLAHRNNLACTAIDGTWYDIGCSEDFLRANLAFALRDDHLRAIVMTITDDHNQAAMHALKIHQCRQL